MNINFSSQFEENFIDVTQFVIENYKEIPADIFNRDIVKPPENLHPQAAEMFVYMSAHMGIQIDVKEKVYEDYSHAVNCLALSDCLASCELSKTKPSFDSPNKGPDPWVKSTFTLQMMDELNREQAARIKNGMWKVFYDIKSDTMHVCLTKIKRASVLNALDSVAKEDYFRSLMPNEQNFEDIDSVYYAVTSSTEYLSYLIESDSSSWEQFSRTIGFSVDDLAALHGFLVFLDFSSTLVNHSFWYDEDFLETLSDIYSKAWPEHGKLLEGRLSQLISLFSLSPLESSKFLLPVPFYKLYGGYLRNPSFVKYQVTAIGLLTIAIRKNENLWSRTLGSTLAKAADRVADSLPKFSNIKLATRKKFNGGDIDLALYDTDTKHMFSIEIKTVYDKHRVESLSHRFVNAKVNVPKAVRQLRETEEVLKSNLINMSDIFGENLEQPKKVHNVLLTWFDNYDLTIGTNDEDIFSLNFCLLRIMLKFSKGNLELMAKSIYELRNIWLLSKERHLDLGQANLNSHLEEQVNVIDSREDLFSLNLSSLTNELLEKFLSLTELKDKTGYISYFPDTKKALS